MKEVFVVNQYIQTPENGTLTRHYTFAPYMEKHGYHATLLTASAIHNSDANMITDKQLMLNKNIDGRDFVYVRTASYTGNGLKRIKNMLDYYFNVQRVAKALGKQGKRPDVIYASSPQILACLAALKIAKHFHVPCVCEVRDLWPESIVHYQHISPRNPAILFLRGIEKKIYASCNSLIFTMSGAYDYVKSRGWGRCVDENKVFYINNGIELSKFDENANAYVLEDTLLNDTSLFKVVYCGSIRKVNNLITLIDSVHLAKTRYGLDNLVLLIYGRGNQEEELGEHCKANGIDNVYFRGFVSKDYIPSITVRADVNSVCVMKTALYSLTGISSNKTFEYMAAGKPILSNAHSREDLITIADCGIVCETDAPEEGAAALAELYKMNDEKRAKCYENARKMAAEYDYSVLTEKLCKAFEYALENNK